MRVVLLTTETAHHAYLAWKLAEHNHLAGVILEEPAPPGPYDTHHPFEDRRDEYESDVLLAGMDGSPSDLAPTVKVSSVNDAVHDVKGLKPDLVVDFGTRRITQELIGAAPVCLNLHGGNPEQYRGLDSHLWVVYRHDWDQLVTTLHHMDGELDTGPIAGQEPVPVSRKMPLYKLRAQNTWVCTELVMEALRTLETPGFLPRREQARKGRYYGAMPAVLKEVCVRVFDAHTGNV